MRLDGENRKYLPGTKTTIGVTMDLEELAEGCDVLVLVVPSSVVLQVVDSLIPHLQPRHTLLDLAKGLAATPAGARLDAAAPPHPAPAPAAALQASPPGTSTSRSVMETLSTCIERKLEAAGRHNHVAVLTGPTIAPEVARGVTTTALVACKEATVAVDLARDLSTPSFLLRAAADPRGAELWGAFKNPIALACGMVDGLHPEGGDNLKAALVMAGFREGMEILEAMGARHETAFGPAGLGDLYVTSTSQSSRNRTLGQKLGSGLPLADAQGEMHMVAEGVRAARMFHAEAQALGIKRPFLDAVVAVVAGTLPPGEAAGRMDSAL
jgi:glycerol-3-phosphate dehydrogenase (NAD(P)+)